MANPDTFAAFLSTGLSVYPPDPGRRHALVLWNHGAGWAGYGADNTCSQLKAYSQSACDMLSMNTLVKGAGPGTYMPSSRL